MNLTELREEYIGKLGTDGDLGRSVVVYDAYFRVVLYNVPLVPTLKVQPLDGGKPYEVEPDNIKWVEELFDLK